MPASVANSIQNTPTRMKLYKDVSDPVIVQNAFKDVNPPTVEIKIGEFEIQLRKVTNFF